MKENQRTTVTKRMLKEGLLRLLKIKPLDKISIVELCNESGINRTTFYRHYEFPADLLKEMQADFVEEMQNSLKKPMTEKDLTQIIDYLQQNSELVSLFICYNSDTEWTDMFHTLYQNIYGTENLKFFDAESQELFFTFLSGGTYFLLRQWLSKKDHKTSEDITSIILEVTGNVYDEK